MSLAVSIFFLALFGTCKAQLLGFGGCPDHKAITDFEPEKFLGTWYDVERLFTVTELASKCVVVNYEMRPDGQIYVENLVTNRFSGVQRKILGTLKFTKNSNEGKYSVKYGPLPLIYDYTMNVLDTDYTSFAVIYACNPIGPLGNTQYVWVMTRERFPPGPVLQRAYGVLDKYKITRTFFTKTDHSDCEFIPPPEEAYDPAEEAYDPAEEERKLSEKITNKTLVKNN